MKDLTHSQSTDMSLDGQACSPEIAVVGISGHYPGAQTLQHFWENVLARRQQFRRMPDIRLPLSDYYHPDPAAPDTTYGSRAAVLDGFQFDWAKRRIPKTTVDTTDIVHWLTLEIAIAALEDAGFSRKTVPTDRTGVVLGNTMTGEQTRSATVRLRWPFVRKTLRASAQARKLPPETIDDLVETMEVFYKSVFAPVTEDSLAGSLSNTIAGRVCNYFNFDGGGYTVDGACSSSLLAIADACNKLVNGDLDLALTGGVDISLDTFELIGFAKTGALTATDMTVYDRKASGFIPGEGCGFVVLKRLEDARRDGDYVYAVIRGWGISSDGKGGITAPSSIGQSKAIRRAYEKAGYSPQTLDFIEGHGTGTPKGDRTELEGVSRALAEDGEPAPRTVGMTSFKSIVGHTKAASGIGAFIKTIMAVNQRIIPPTAGCHEPNPVFETTAKCLYPVITGEIRRPESTLKAGTFGAGFGGINCHVALTSGDAPTAKFKPTLDERALMVSNQDCELFILAAASVDAMLQEVHKVTEQADGISVAEMADLAAKLSQDVAEHHPIRAALIASTPEDLLAHLKHLEQILNDQPPAPGEVLNSPEQTLLLSNQVHHSRVAFLFPGQGSQRLAMARTLVERYPWAQELLAQADQQCHKAGLKPISSVIYPPLERQIDEAQGQEWKQQLAQTEVAQPAICLASLMWMRYLNQLGIKPVAVGGHSLGELTAFCAAGAFDEASLIDLAIVRGQAMSASNNEAGTMACLTCSHDIAEQLIQQANSDAVVANINSPSQTIISGSKASVDAVLQLAAKQEVQTRALPVSNAFHSSMMAAAAERFQTEASIADVLPSFSTRLFSGMDGQAVHPDRKLREYFADQMLSQVNFIALTQTIAAECDLMVEVGPGRVLTNLANSITEQAKCFSLGSKVGSAKSLNSFLAALFVQGGDVNWSALYDNRLVRPFVPASEKVFIENQCERPFNVPENVLSKPIPQANQGVGSGTAPGAPGMMPTTDSLNGLDEHLTNYFFHRSKFLAQLVQADIETLPQFSSDQ